MTNIIKKAGIGTYINLAVFLLSLISLIIYAANGAAEGYFKGLTDSAVITMSVFAVLLSAATLVLPFIAMKEPFDKAINIALILMKIGVSILLVSSLFLFISSRVEGLAYIFFSNEDVIAEVQTPANLASANTAITGFIFYGITWLVAMITVFFSPLKKEKAE